MTLFQIHFSCGILNKIQNSSDNKQNYSNDANCSYHFFLAAFFGLLQAPLQIEESKTKTHKYLLHQKNLLSIRITVITTKHIEMFTSALKSLLIKDFIIRIALDEGILLIKQHNIALITNVK